VDREEKELIALAMPNMCTDVRRCQELKMPVFRF
jgi:hypothetical protein